MRELMGGRNGMMMHEEFERGDEEGGNG